MDYSLDSCPSTGGGDGLPAVPLATWLGWPRPPKTVMAVGAIITNEVAERQGETSAE
ncbi:MAG: hypothetical protein IVW52_06965 [Acidimicrobiales bacterium]|nr:hypothetical protein [Acidimicrobiales bacterium]